MSLRRRAWGQSGMTDRGSTFITIRWEQAHSEAEETVLVRATLCRQHRRGIADGCPSARGCGQTGHACDACEGRQPGRA
jgi:hypothetical protein